MVPSSQPQIDPPSTTIHLWAPQQATMNPFSIALGQLSEPLVPTTPVSTTPLATPETEAGSIARRIRGKTQASLGVGPVTHKRAQAEQRQLTQLQSQQKIRKFQQREILSGLDNPQSQPILGSIEIYPDVMTPEVSQSQC